MRRGVVIGISIMGVVLVILAVALATVGTQLDQAKIRHEDLQFEVDDLRQQVTLLSDERGKLRQQLEEQQKEAQRLHTELEQHSQATSPASSALPAASASQAPAQGAPSATP